MPVQTTATWPCIPRTIAPRIITILERCTHAKIGPTIGFARQLLVPVSFAPCIRLMDARRKTCCIQLTRRASEPCALVSCARSFRVFVAGTRLSIKVHGKGAQLFMYNYSQWPSMFNRAQIKHPFFSRWSCFSGYMFTPLAISYSLSTREMFKTLSWDSRKLGKHVVLCFRQRFLFTSFHPRTNRVLLDDYSALVQDEIFHLVHTPKAHSIIAQLFRGFSQFIHLSWALVGCKRAVGGWVIEV